MGRTRVVSIGDVSEFMDGVFKRVLDGELVEVEFLRVGDSFRAYRRMLSRRRRDDLQVSIRKVGDKVFVEPGVYVRTYVGDAP